MLLCTLCKFTILHHFHTTALCPDPLDIVNGTATFTGNTVGDTATYTCDSGFELIGNASVTCTQVDVNSAAFTPAAPVCRRECCMNIFDSQMFMLHVAMYIV